MINNLRIGSQEFVIWMFPLISNNKYLLYSVEILNNYNVSLNACIDRMSNDFMVVVLYEQVLESFKIMDFSMLLGIYNLDIAAQEVRGRPLVVTFYCYYMKLLCLMFLQRIL